MTLRYAQNPTDPKGRLRANLQAYAIGGFLIASILVFNLIQMLSVVIYPFSQSAFFKINQGLADTWWGWCVSLSEWTYDIRFIISGDEIPADENAFVFANHQQMPDIIALLSLAKRKGRLGGLKWFVKNAIRYVPGVGWGLGFLDCIFLKRNWADDRERIEATFQRLVDRKMPFWVVAFSEGTRITEDKLKQSQLYARTHDKRVPKHVLLPRTKGFVATIEGLRSVLHAVYDVTIAYPKGIPSLRQWVRGYCPEVRINLKRYPIAAIPTDRPELAKWLEDRFVEKDQLMERVLADGFFPALEWKKTPPAKRSIAYRLTDPTA